MLDMMGMIGGLFEAQTLIGLILVGSYNRYALTTFLANNLVRYVS